MNTTPHGPVEPDIGHLKSFPDPPRNPDEWTWFRVLALSGVSYFLSWHFGTPETTVMNGKVYIAPHSLSEIKGLRAPDMLIAFNADPDACARRNAYVISEQGKPPDFVMEVASPSTGRIDVRDKPADYAALGIPEYWRFDETGESYGARLAGDRLVGDCYKPIAIAELPNGSLEGYSQALELKLRWERGQLKCYDPTTTKPIMSLAEMQHIAEEERQGRLEEQKARLEAERRAEDAERRREEAERREETERQARLDAERIAAERIRELEAKLHRRGP
ncbi:MAG: Uma2 family endonuclease [Caldilineaceae bacterium SB0665_bin_21]|nr:Uma2 family endonuclease [Caldilineaceae bacterium SB0665_bin_21]